MFTSQDWRFQKWLHFTEQPAWREFTLEIHEKLTAIEPNLAQELHTFK